MQRGDEIGRAFIDHSQERLRDYLSQVERCLSLLSEDQIWSRPNDVSNSVGNLVLHLTGNVRQWILGGVGGRSIDRDRAHEFAEQGPVASDHLFASLRQALMESFDVIGVQSSIDLLERVRVRGYDVTKLDAMYHVVEHFALHTGQIVYATKALLGRHLDIYDADGRRLDSQTTATR